MVNNMDTHIYLSRGGILIPTSGGNIQFGIPPETIKDTMKLEGGVPGSFIVPQFMFSLSKGIALAEMEFPIYYNFFIKKGKTRIICNKNQQKRIETIISEALFGPASLDIVQEFAQGENTPGFPELRAEMDSFRKTPLTSKGFLELDDLIEFCVFDKDRNAKFDNIVVHYDNNYSFSISENGKEIASIGRNVPIISDKSAFSGTRLNFRPPLFGITTLGSGHGFDPNAETSGLIIWINRRGIMVDPPVNSTEKLLSLGVSPKLIDSIILTHCHADHDVGTLQKILQDGKVTLYTTSTIFKSFIKKSEALTGIEENRLKQLVNFHPVLIGKQMIIAGGRFNFNYTLHPIPTISIQVSLLGKSMIYSSDTMNDPAYINKLFDDQILTKNRRDFLINFPWHNDVIFHEAGIPPIHTPMSYLCSLPREIRERTYLVHVNPDDIPKGSGLRIAPTGMVNTLELDVKPLLHDEAIEKLDAFAHIELFENLTFKKARELLLVSEVNHYNAADVIFRKDDRGDKFYVVINGEVDIILDGKIITTYGIGGYFGEKSIFLDENRTATAIAKTSVKLLSIQKDEMLSLIRGTESEDLLRQVADFQTTELRETLQKNIIIASLTATQQTQLHGLIKPVTNSFSAGEIVADKHSAPKFTYIIREGNIDVCRDNNLIDTLTEGELFGVSCLFSENDPTNFSFIAKNNVRLYYIEHSNLKKYLDQNPGAFIKMYHIIY